MHNITTFEVLEHTIKQISGQPTVLEALWDGDSQGWYLLFYLYTKPSHAFSKQATRHFLGEVSVSEGMGQFTNEQWAVPELAKQLGEKAIEKYNLTFYFPSPKDADNNCPKWTDRHLAIQCTDCNKLFIPTNSPYLPKDICFHCHLAQEQNEKIKKAAPCDDGIAMYLLKNNEYENIGYSTHFKDFTIAPFIAEKVKDQLTDTEISIITLNKQDIVALKEKLENVLAQKLAKYEKPKIDEQMKRLISTCKVKYKEQEYELMDKFNNDHAEIANLIANIATASKAIAADLIYQIFFKKGITYRDDTVLRFVHYVCKGITSRLAIINRYASVLTENDVLDTIKKLERIRCLTVNGEEVCITSIGRCII